MISKQSNLRDFKVEWLKIKRQIKKDVVRQRYCSVCGCLRPTLIQDYNESQYLYNCNFCNYSYLVLKDKFMKNSQ